MIPRYAIYFTPAADHPLYELTAQWLGYDAYSGSALPTTHPDLLALRPTYAEHLSIPARYGAHATIKAPFRLQEGCSEKVLSERFEDFCRAQSRIECAPLRITRLGPFIALMLSESSDQLDNLATNVVEHFENLGAPMNEAERARRNPDQLTERQQRYLNQWGYPYVKEEFRFHISLTSAIATEQERQIAHKELAEIFDELFAHEHWSFDRLHLFKQDRPEDPFRIIQTGLLGDSNP